MQCLRSTASVLQRAGTWLPVPYGAVEVEYIVESSGGWRTRNHAWAQSIRYPSGERPDLPMRRLIAQRFHVETVYELEWLDDVIDVAESQRSSLSSSIR